MTREHRIVQIRAETAKGDDVLRAGDALVGLDLFDDSVTRFYYAVYHYACALFLTEDVETSSHRGLHTLFSQHLVRTGKIEPSRAKDLKRLQGYREAADYDRHFRFDRVGAEEEASVAKRFVERAREYLRTDGWSP